MVRVLLLACAAAITLSIAPHGRHNHRQHGEHTHRTLVPEASTQKESLNEADTVTSEYEETADNRFAVAELGAQGESGLQVMDPTMGIITTAKVVAVAAQLIFAVATARKAASIETASKATDRIAEGLEERLQEIQKLLGSATEEASNRLGDTVQEIAEIVVDAVATHAPNELREYTSKLSMPADSRPDDIAAALKARLQLEYDAKLGLGGTQATTDNDAFILINAMPLMDALQDVLKPVTDDQLDSAFDEAAQQLQDKQNVPNLASQAFTTQVSALANAQKILIEQRKATKSASSATSSGSAGMANMQAGGADAAERVKAMVDAHTEAVAGEFADAADGFHTDGADVALGKERAKGLTRLFSGYQDNMSEDEFEAQMLPLSAAMGVLSAVQSLVSVFNGFAVMKTAEFEAWRRVGVAFEAAGYTTQEAEYNVCRLLVSLYEQLRSFSNIPANQITNLRWEILVEGPLLQSLPLDSDEALLHDIRRTIHGKLCAVFFPLRKRLGAFYRHDGRCAQMPTFFPVTKQTSFRAVFDESSLESTSAFANILSCHPRDIYDMRLVRLSEAKDLDGWETVKSDFWPTGELNAELSVNSLRSFFGSGKAGKAQKPDWSRVLQIKRCSALYDQQTRALLFDPTQKGNDRLLRPLTDMKVVLRTKDADADGLSKVETDLIAAGYERVEFHGVQSSKTSLTSVLKKGNHLFTWWDSEEYNVKYTHSDPSDLNYMMYERRPPLFIYVRRGVMPVPLREITILPFLNTDVDSDKRISFVQEIRKGFSEAKYGKDPKTKEPLRRADTHESYEFAVDDITPPDSSCTIKATRHLDAVLNDDKKGLKHSVVRYITRRKWSGTLVEETSIQFDTQCADDDSSAERWQRVAVSPYEGSFDEGVFRMLYFWMKKAYTVVPVPDTTQPEAPCPEMCALQKNNKFTAQA